MGVTRDGGYSATIESFVVIRGTRLRIAKTSADTLVLAEPCSVAAEPESEVELLITVDGIVDSTRITLVDGLSPGQGTCRYGDAVPF